MIHKILGESYGIYEGLFRDSMYEWFTYRGELKDGQKQYVNEGSSHFQGRAQHNSILFNYLEVEDHTIKTLKAHKKA
jgi:hypothetical protein